MAMSNCLCEPAACAAEAWAASAPAGKLHNKAMAKHKNSILNPLTMHSPSLWRSLNMAPRHPKLRSGAKNYSMRLMNPFPEQPGMGEREQDAHEEMRPCDRTRGDRALPEMNFPRRNRYISEPRRLREKEPIVRNTVIQCLKNLCGTFQCSRRPRSFCGSGIFFYWNILM